MTGIHRGSVCNASLWEGKIVLFAEDDCRLRLLLACFLTRSGFDYVAVSDGMEAVTAFRKHVGVVNTVILDVEMPRLDGFVAMEFIREIDPTARVVLTSACSLEEIQRRRLTDAEWEFLPKPFSQQDIDRLLRRRSERDEIQRSHDQ